ncbi:oxidoreductase [Haloechinothrix sp. YIM 98757]|uniref:Oxidoreductase n=1 Tax=Haloechinothrix aidingensis TaxID=2752311 RepID=A0A838A6R7_9PSEU|nr:oxidoreductase [Haloechinothrix aidingensis]
MIDPKTGGILRRKGQRANAPIFQREGCYITGTLDLRGAELDYLLRFTNCRFENPPDVREAGLLGLMFNSCWLPGLRARNLHSKNDVRLINSTVRSERGSTDSAGTGTSTAVLDGGRGRRAAVNLTDAVVDGSVVLAGSVIEDAAGYALHADRIRINGALLAYRMTTTGEVWAPGLRTGGNVNLAEARLDNGRGVALNASGAVVGGLLVCESLPHSARSAPSRAFTARGSVFLSHAHVHGDVLLRGAWITINPESPVAVDSWSGAMSSGDPEIDPRPAIAADRLRVDGNIECGDGFVSNGTVRMVNAVVGGSLHLARGRIAVRRGEAPPYYDRALHLDGSDISGDIQAGGLIAEGQLRLGDLRVGGNVLATNVGLHHPGRDVLAAPRTQVSGNINLSDSVIAGTVQLQAVQVGDNVELAGTQLTQPAQRTFRSYSLDMRTARVGRDLVLSRSESANVLAEGGVNLDGAVVTRRVSIDGARLRSLPERHSRGDGRGPRAGGTALDASDLVAEELLMAPHEPPDGRVVLRRTGCGTLDDNSQLWQATRGVELEEFRYDALRNPIDLEDDAEVERRIRWLRDAMQGYRPGPYDQLANMLRTSGNEEHATTVSIRKEQYRYEALARGSRMLGPGVRLWSWMQRAMVGYGYRPMRALGWLLALLVAGSLWFGLGTDDCVNHPERFQVNGPRCVVNVDDTGLEWNPVLHTVDLLVPIVDFGNKGRWHMGGVDKWVATGFTASGWVLATTVAAGITRALRRQ